MTLKGTVEEDRQKNKAEKIAKKVSGVKSVDNEIKIAHPTDRLLATANQQDLAQLRV